MPDKTLDTKGLACPLPILKTKKALSELPKGAKLEVLATDPWLGARLHRLLRVRPAMCSLEHSQQGGRLSLRHRASRLRVRAMPSDVILGLVPRTHPSGCSAR